MIKKLLWTLTILWLWFFGVSFWNYWYWTIWTSVTSTINSDYSVSILNNFEFATTYLWTLKRVFDFDWSGVFYWNLDWTLSIWFDTWWNKWDIGYYFVCDYNSSFNWTFSNCNWYDYTENIDIINNSLNKIKNTDKFVYWWHEVWTNYLTYIWVISSVLNKTIVFPYWICWANCYTPLNIDWINFYWLDEFEVLWNPYYDNFYYIWLNNLSQGWYNFSTIPNEIIWVSPAFNNNNNWWNNNWSQIYTWKNYYCPTFEQILNNYWWNYNTWLCYNWTLRYNNGQIETVQKKDIFTVFTNYDNFTDRIGIYNNNCKTPATQQNCENAFSGEREKYNIIWNIINNNVDDKNIWNYCNIALNYDLNATTCVASWYNQAQPTPEELLNIITEIWNIWDIKTPTTWNILNNLIWTGETREDIATRDLFWQINQIQDKISSIFTNRSGKNGIIPDYILRLILTTLLLTVLLKK